MLAPSRNNRAACFATAEEGVLRIEIEVVVWAGGEHQALLAVLGGVLELPVLQGQ